MRSCTSWLQLLPRRNRHRFASSTALGCLASRIRFVLADRGLLREKPVSEDDNPNHRGSTHTWRNIVYFGRRDTQLLVVELGLRMPPSIPNSFDMEKIKIPGPHQPPLLSITNYLSRL